MLFLRLRVVTERAASSSRWRICLAAGLVRTWYAADPDDASWRLV